MKIHCALGLFLGLAECATAATSFAGSNLYYAAGLTQTQQTTLFTGLKDAGVQVLRVWLDGKFTLVSQPVTFLLQQKIYGVVLTIHRPDVSSERDIDKQLPQSRRQCSQDLER